jgi:molybdenum cofactor cytidylyltransferase
MLAPLGEEKEPLLRKVIGTWRDVGIEELIVVLGSNAADIRAAFEENLLGKVIGEKPVRFLENSRWSAGMFSSVKAGLAAVSPVSAHIAISPADLPFLSKSSLRTVIEASASVDSRTVVVPTFSRRRGHPLVIPAALRDRILSWPDTERLSRIFDEPDVDVLHLEGFDDSILRDVDRPDDLLP